MKTWKIALVGCGDIAENTYMAQMHRNRRVQVVACCDLKPERTALFQSKFGIPRAYSRIEELLEKEDFEILMDTASIPAHYELNMKALKAGKHLYSQKPIGLTVEQATEMIETAKKMGVTFAAAPIHMLRNDIREAKRLIDGGVIGKVNLVRAMAAHGGPEYFQYRVNDPSWFYEPGAGALYDLGVHALHQVTGLLGPAKKAACTAAISSPRRIIRSGNFNNKAIASDKLYDNYLIHLDFGNGTIADVITGFCVKASTASSLEIYGEFGSIIFTDNPAHPLKVYIDEPERKIRGWLDEGPQERPEEEFFQCSCIADLIDAIEQGRPSRIPPEHARHVIELICAIEDCAKDGKTRELSTTF
ncbi:MAG: Gfo/Idh/MocA family oxidoreductase [Treponema sp.]|jgi:predicted dehydrogenase|nr:Gfo/Idh/MocA family oxidoreductase [Treponema sp.]